MTITDPKTHAVYTVHTEAELLVLLWWLGGRVAA